jgi:iron(III) transport system permease protein
MIGAPLWMHSDPASDFHSLFEERQLGLAANSLGLAAGATCLSLIFGIPLAFLISRTELLGRRIFGVLSIVPVLIPPYIHAIVWSHLDSFWRPYFAWDVHSVGGAILVLAFAYFPFVTLMVFSGLQSIDRNLEEVSLLRHGRWETLSRITVPLVTPHILSGAIFVFIFSIIDFGVPDILRVRVYPVEIFIQFSAFYNEQGATILSLPLVGMTFFLIVLQKYLMKRRLYIQLTGGQAEPKRYDLGRLNIPAFAFCVFVIGFSVLLPVGVLFKVAGHIENYHRVLLTSQDQILYSLVLACSGSVLGLILAFPLAYLIDRLKARMRTTLEFISLIPLAVPATTLGIGLIKLWNRPVVDEIIYGSALIIIFGYVARFIPFLTISAVSGLKQVSPQLEEAAFLTTSRWSKVMGRIVIPLSRRSILAGFFFGFILCFGELGTTLLVIPPGRETVPIKIYNLMHYGAEQLVAALCLTLIVIILGIAGLFLIIHRRFLKPNGRSN